MSYLIQAIKALIIISLLTVQGISMTSTERQENFYPAWSYQMNHYIEAFLSISLSGFNET